MNEEEARERQRAAMRRYMRRVRAENPEKYREQHRRWLDANREKTRAYDRERRTADPTKAAASDAANHANQTAKQLGLVGRLRTIDVLALWERQPACLICGNGRGLDHVIPMTEGGENTPANIQTLCPSCNTEKEGGRKNVARTCKSGHELAGDNLYVIPRTGQRFCRECGRRRSRELTQRKKALHGKATGCAAAITLTTQVSVSHRVAGSSTGPPPDSSIER